MKRKVGRNAPCPCGSGKKFKKCCLNKQSISQNTSLSVIPPVNPETPFWTVNYNLQNPPDVFFDTNVWIGMNENDITSLKILERHRGFRYRYSITNYVEVLSHLEDVPSESCQDPFKKYQRCLQKMIEICFGDVLPTPEMEFLAISRLEHHLDPVWVPNTTQIPLSIEIIANANNLNEVTGKGITNKNNLPRWVVKPSHYKKLRETDGESFRLIMEHLKEIQPPIKGTDKNKLNKLILWVFKLANFFFLVRPSGKKTHYDLLTSEERGRFDMTLTEGSGKLFFTHCVSVAKRAINERKKVDTNDLYDMMQLLLLQDEKRLFVTEDKSFYRYRIESNIQRVVPWSSFRKINSEN